MSEPTLSQIDDYNKKMTPLKKTQIVTGMAIGLGIATFLWLMASVLTSGL